MQTIDRAFAVLRALAGRAETSTLAEVSQACGLPKTTTLRILGALEDLAMVDRVGDRYGLGPGLDTLTHHATPAGAVRELSRPELAALAGELGENASVAVADGDQVLYLDTVADEGVVQVPDWTGQRVPYHGSAAGLALMSTWTDGRITRYGRNGLETLTPATISTLSVLRRRIAAVRADGFVWTRSEFSEEVNGIAAPIVAPGRDEAIGSLTVYGPLYRFPGDRPTGEIERLVVEAADRIAQQLVAQG